MHRLTAAAVIIMVSTAFAVCVPSAEAANAAQSKSAKKRSAERPYGREGDPRKVKRVITIDASDAMRYFPDEVRVRRGDTVRFVVRNSGKSPHEMVIGTMDELKKHAELVRRHEADLASDEPNVTRVQPGQSGKIVWQFTRAGEFYYGCLIPGHFDAGMMGTIVVRAPPAKR
jgi:uncharacterized cupredoxin-like copper-binding protein